MFVHEIALYSDHNIDELRLPPIADGVASLQDRNLVPARVDSLFICLQNIHAVFDAFLQMDIAESRSLPNLFFVRTGYAAKALKKMTEIWEDQTRLGGHAYPLDLKFDYYMDALIERLSRVGHENKRVIANSFMLLLKSIRTEGYNQSEKGGSITRKTQQVPGAQSAGGAATNEAPLFSHTRVTAAHEQMASPVGPVYEFPASGTNLYALSEEDMADLQAFQYLDPTFAFDHGMYDGTWQAG